MDVLGTIGLIVAAIGLVGTAYGLSQANKQIEQASNIALGDFLINIDQMLLEYHNDVHVKLKPGGDWNNRENPNAGPDTSEELAAIETYMGLFERIFALMQRGIIPKEIVDRFYRYRIKNIVANKQICEKIIEGKSGWSDFILLCEELEVEIPCMVISHSLVENRKSTLR